MLIESSSLTASTNLALSLRATSYFLKCLQSCGFGPTVLNQLEPALTGQPQQDQAVFPE